MIAEILGRNKSQFNKLLVPLSIATLWLLVVLYHNKFALQFLLRVPHGPFTPEGFSRFLRESVRLEFPPLLILLVTALGSWGLGLAVFKGLKIEPRRLIDHFMAFALGIGSFASGLFYLGLLQVFYRPVIWAYAAIFLGWGLFNLRSRIRGFEKRESWSFREPVWTVLGGVIVLSALWHGFVIALAPILPGDSTIYHLCLPKLYLEAHRLYAIPWNVFSHWPHLMEMLFALPMSLGADRGAPLIHWLMSASLAASVFLVGHQEVDEQVAWMAAIFIVSQRAFLKVSGTAYIDGAFGFFAFLSMVALWNGIKDHTPSWIIVGGLLGGMATATKLLGAVTLTLSLLWILWRVPQGRKRRTALLFVIPAVIVVGPWWLKTWVTAGNPVWPFLPWLFSRSNELADASSALWKPYQQGQGLAITLSQLSTVPLSSNWAGDVFRPFFFLSFVALLFRSQWPPIMSYWFFPVLPYLATLDPESDFRRYLAPLWGHMYLWNAWVLGMISRWKTFMAIPVMAVVLSLAVPVWQTNEVNALIALSHWRGSSAAAHTTEEFYWGQESPDVLTLKKMDSLLGPEDKVFLIHEVHAYYLTHRYELAFSFGQPRTVFRRIKNVDQLANNLRSKGFTHVLIRDYPEFFRQLFSDAHYDELVAGLALRYGKELFAKEGRYLYKLDFSSLPAL